MKDIKKILFVCTGNSCRSIMAEAYFNKLIGFEDAPFEARSAGTIAIEGLLPSDEVLVLLGQEAINTTPYKSKPLKRENVEWADLILVMAPEHRMAVLDISPGSAEKVRFLGEFNPVGEEVVIPDPIGRPMAFYRSSFGIIKQSLEELIKWLKG